jgi:hypothetical protein
MKTRKQKGESLTRTVKIDDELHYRIRLMSVKLRIPMQDMIDRLLKRGMRSNPRSKAKIDAKIEHEQPEPVTQ